MKIIIVDTQADAIAAMLQKTNGELTITGLYTDGDQGVEAICSQLPDLAFVNIDLAGMAPLADLGQYDRPEVEFVLMSEWATFAYEAFRFGAADFLLKPFRDEELQQTFERAAKKVRDKVLIKNAYPIVSSLFPRLQDNRIAVQHGETIDYIPVRNIVYCEEGKTGCRIVLNDKSVKELPGPPGDLEPQLRQHPFQRVSRSCIVNLYYVEQYKFRDDRLILKEGVALSVSASLRAELLQRLRNG